MPDTQDLIEKLTEYLMKHQQEVVDPDFWEKDIFLRRKELKKRLIQFFDDEGMG
jgi:hypothetical protein